MSEMVRYGEGGLIRSMADAERAATAMARSGYFQDAKDAAQAIVKILAGQEMGFGPFASMTGVYIISGRPAIGANLMAAAVKRSGRYDYRVTEMTDKACEICFYQDGKPVGVSTFTAEDAKKAGTKNLDKFARNMLFARAISNGVRWYCPDVFAGAPAYTPEELGAEVDGEGNVIDAPVVEVHPGQEPARQPEAPASQPSKPKGTQPTRPYDPWTLADLIRVSIERRTTNHETLGPRLDSFKRAVVGNLEACFDGNEQARHLVAHYLTGKASSKDWDDAETMALHKWLNATEQDGEWVVDPLACQEAHAVYNTALQEQGQQTLFEDGAA